MIRSGGVCDHMHVYVVRMHVCRCVCIVHMFDACGHIIHTYIHTYIYIYMHIHTHTHTMQCVRLFDACMDVRLRVCVTTAS
jgi:hypothetical protein